jgi:hypothetical protein
LSVILASLVKVYEDDKDEELESALNEAICALLTSVDDAEGLNTLMMVFIGWFVISGLPTSPCFSNNEIQGQA